MTTKEKMNPKMTARVAGLLYLMIAIFGIFSMLYGPESLIVVGDAGATTKNIAASETMYRFAFMGDLLGQVFFILLVLLLYKLLKPLNKEQAVLMVVLVLVGVPIAMLNDLNQISAMMIASGAGNLGAFEGNQLQAHVMLFLELYQIGLHIAFIFWGLWLLPLGYLVFKSGFMPKILGILLVIAGYGYLFEFLVYFLLPDLDLTIKMFTFWGEVFLALWLLIKTVNVKKWEERALEAA